MTVSLQFYINYISESIILQIYRGGFYQRSHFKLFSRKSNTDNLICLLADQANDKNTLILNSALDKQDFIMFEYTQIHIVEKNTNHKGGLFTDDKTYWTLHKPMVFMSTCHLKLVVWDGNLVKSS